MLASIDGCVARFYAIEGGRLVAALLVFFQGDLSQYLSSTGLVARIVLLILGYHLPQVSAL
jgi:hypothetical protein